MSQIDNLFDGGKGSLGNLVFFRRHGKNYVRTKPVRFRDRKSPAQLAQRQRMQVVNRLLKPFSGLVRISFAPEALGHTSLHEAQSFNMRHALAGAYPEIHADMSRVLLSTGPLPVPEGGAVSVHPGGLLIEWVNSDGVLARHSFDTLVVMAYSEKTGHGDYKFTEVYRKEGSYVWNPALPLQINELPVVWIAFRNREQTEMSRNRIVHFE